MICDDCGGKVGRLTSSLFEDVWPGDWNGWGSSIVVVADGKDIVENVWSSSSNKLEANLKYIPMAEQNKIKLRKNLRL